MLKILNKIDGINFTLLGFYLYLFILSIEVYVFVLHCILLLSFSKLMRKIYFAKVQGMEIFICLVILINQEIFNDIILVRSMFSHVYLQLTLSNSNSKEDRNLFEFDQQKVNYQSFFKFLKLVTVTLNSFELQKDSNSRDLNQRESTVV